ncbi:MAG: dockerin type I repeat-containing protein [Oscillospiraceae bacterium]|jgi:hypothetical protein|nr:dockerin type I repeat-containing protein [Oscillospiraceae bacterium]
MKKIIIILMTIILAFSVFTINSKGSEINPYLEFSTLEDFLNAYLIAKEGGCIEELIERGWWPWGENPAESVNFSEFKILYLPTGIPEGFIIDNILIGGWNINFEYIPESVEVTTNISNNSFNTGFTIYRDYSLDKHKAAFSSRIINLNNGNYALWYSNYVSFYWESDGQILSLGINLRQQDTEEFKELFGDGDVLDLVRFAETRTVDLTDEEEVRNLIKFGERFQRGDISASGRVTTSDALEILRFVAGSPNVIEGDERAMAAADVNGDGKIDTADALRILRIVAGLA